MSQSRRWICFLTITYVLSGATHPRFKTSAGRGQACATSLNNCPDQGCGGGDRPLNKKKNMRQMPNPSDYQVITFDDFRHLQEEAPTEWKQNQSRAEVEQLGEGNAVMLAGYLLGAHSGSPETCNCKLSGEENNDYHINVTENSDDAMTDSVVVEMTPKMRASIPQWNLTTLNALKGKQIRVSGYLLFDSEHVTRSGGERMTIWEIHPVTRFEVCRTASCPPESDEGWNDIQGQ